MHQAGLRRPVESLRLQNEALEEHNANQAREIDSLKLEVRELRDRLQGGFTNDTRTETTCG